MSKEDTLVNTAIVVGVIGLGSLAYNRHQAKKIAHLRTALNIEKRYHEALKDTFKDVTTNMLSGPEFLTAMKKWMENIEFRNIVN